MIPFRQFILPKIHAGIASGRPLSESVDEIFHALSHSPEKTPEEPKEEIPYLKQHHTRIDKGDLFNPTTEYHDELSGASYALSNHYHFQNPEHKEILTRYTGTRHTDPDANGNIDHVFRYINARILGIGDRVHVPTDEHNMKTMDEALHVHAAPHDLVTYSGMGEDHGHTVATNDRVHHPAYLSSSLNPTLALGFAGHQTHGWDTVSHMMKIHVPAGHPGAYVEHLTRNRNEHEFILPRNTTLRIDHSKRELVHTKKTYGRGDMYTFIHHAYPETK